MCEENKEGERDDRRRKGRKGERRKGRERRRGRGGKKEGEGREGKRESKTNISQEQYSIVHGTGLVFCLKGGGTRGARGALALPNS